jgi:hypothetical protein
MPALPAAADAGAGLSRPPELLRRIRIQTRMRATLLLSAFLLGAPVSTVVTPLAATDSGHSEADRRAAVRTIEAAGTRVQVEVIGVDDPERIDALQRWVEEAAHATRLPSGRFPLGFARVQVRQIASRDPSPVPWGQTSRQGEVSIQLFVRADAGDEQLRADWTAVHEFAHLAHPYLGERGRWLAEGLASYHQNILRARAGMIAPDDAWRRLDAGFRRGEAVGEGGALGESGRARGATMRVYWAGAAYWLEMDLALRRMHDTSLIAVLDRHAHCCLDGNAHVAPEAFVAELDRVAGTELFRPRYLDHAAMRGFPALTDSYRVLGLIRDGGRLRLSDAPDAMRLRAAMTAVATPPRERAGARVSSPASPPRP